MNEDRHQLGGVVCGPLKKLNPGIDDLPVGRRRDPEVPVTADDIDLVRVEIAFLQLQVIGLRRGDVPADAIHQVDDGMGAVDPGGIGILPPLEGNDPPLRRRLGPVRRRPPDRPPGRPVDDVPEQEIPDSQPAKSGIRPDNLFFLVNPHRIFSSPPLHQKEFSRAGIQYPSDPRALPAASLSLVAGNHIEEEAEGE